MQVDYLLLDASALGSPVNDEALQQYFRDHRAEFAARRTRDAAYPGHGRTVRAKMMAKAPGKATDLLAAAWRCRFASLAISQSPDDPCLAKKVAATLGWVSVV